MNAYTLRAGALCASVLLAACGGGGGGSVASTTPAPTTSMGTLSVGLTDAPSCGFDAVNITVSKVRVNQSDSASDTDAGWTDITLAPARKINLLNLTNGVLDTLGQTSLPAGHYSQLRLVLDPNTGNGSANTVVPSGTTTEQPLDTPSAVQSGIKLVNSFDVAAGQRVDLVLDFDACKSVLTKGNGKYALKPVVHVIPTALNGIGGFVSSAVLGSHPKVSAQQNGVIVGATVPNASTGEFVLARLPAGSYDMVLNADGRAAVVIGAIPVTASAITNVSTSTTPLAMPLATSVHDIRGAITLSPANASVGAYAAAIQSIPGGPTVTIAYQGADLLDGFYTLANLPTSAPSYAVYSATLPILPLPRLDVLPGVGMYRVDASAAGYATKSVASVNITTAGQDNVNFTLVP
ncbi:MAG: DUF4382 domain-containing protein [Pseudomonadota bacterium]